MERFRRALSVLAVLVHVAPAWAASEASAEAAVGEALGAVITISQAKALVSFLSQLPDGTAITVTLQGQTAHFLVEGDAVKVSSDAGATPARTPAPRPEGPPVPQAEAPAAEAEVAAPGKWRSALALSIAKRIDLRVLEVDLRRHNRPIMQSSDRALSFVFTATGDEVTITSDGAFCIRSERVLDSLGSVDHLGSQMMEVGTHLLRVQSSSIQEADMDQAWDARDYYSDPPYTFKAAFWDSGAEGLPWQPLRMPADYNAVIHIPDATTLLEARLEIEAYNRAGNSPLMPSFALSGKPIVEGTSGGMRPDRAFADVTDYLVQGHHKLECIFPERVIGGYAPCVFALHIITPPGTEAELQVDSAGETVTSVSSQPLEKIEEQWQSLRGALPE